MTVSVLLVAAMNLSRLEARGKAILFSQVLAPVSTQASVVLKAR